MISVQANYSGSYPDSRLEKTTEHHTTQLAFPDLIPMHTEEYAFKEAKEPE